jgi:hypothetical protein
MNIEKLDSSLNRAFSKKESGPFAILVRFKHAVTQADTAPLGLTAAGDMARGVATVDQIERLTDRDDVMSVSLLQQPKATGGKK